MSTPTPNWLRALNGSGRHAPASRPETRAVVESVLGPGPVSWAVDVGHEMATKIVLEVPSFGLPASFPDVLRMGTESTTLEALLHVDGRAASPPVATHEALLGDREFVRRGIPLDAVLRGIRLSHAVMVRLLLQEAARLLDDPERSIEMERVSDALFEYIDAFASAMTQEYTRERERWLSSGDALRAEAVRAILEDHVAADVDETSRKLSYPIGHHHVAAAVWRDEAGHTDEELLRVAARLIPMSGLTGTLLIPDGTNMVWAWMAHPMSPGSAPTLTPPAAAGVHVAVGSPGRGLAGFRRSHREATQAASVIRATTPMSRRSRPSMATYTDIELSVIAGQNLPLARGLVARELGPLAVDSASAAELRQTAGAYLATNRSLAHAAESLHVARNTVAYRIKKVEAALGRDLHHRRLELELALRLCDQLGRAVLRQPDA